MVYHPGMAPYLILSELLNRNLKYLSHLRHRRIPTSANFAIVRWAGHSKWAKIAKSKGVNDAAKGQLFTRIGKQLQVAVRNGGSDPNSNLALAAALEAAKRANMPKDNVERALRGKEGALMQAVSYEAVGPGGVAFIIDTLTDNTKRSVGNIRSYFVKAGGELQASGAVAWVFAEKGRVEVSLPPGALDDLWEEKLLDAAAAADAEDVEMPASPGFGDEGDNGECTPVATVWCSKDSVATVRAALAKAGFNCVSGQVMRVPTTRQVVTSEAEEALLSLLGKLNRDEDVQGYVHNAEG